MIHPRDLLRADSNGVEVEFSAPVDAAKSTEQVDCGWTFFPRFNKYLDRFATPNIFVLVLSINGFFHGLVLTYFRSTSQVWGKHYNIESQTVGWVIYVNEFLVGVFALFVAYYGNKTHRPKWIGVSTIFLAVAGFLIAAPEIYKPYRNEEVDLDTLKGPSLCQPLLYRNINDAIKPELHIIAFVLVIVFLIVFSVTSISFLCHGISYIDDNISKKHSPGLIGAALAGFEFGKYLGTYFSWVPTYTSGQQNVFFGSVWLVIIFLTFISGSIMTLFPIILPNLLMKKLSASICTLASGYEIEAVTISEDGLFTTLFRLLKNGTYIVNILANIVLQSVLINFETFEDFYNQSKFLLPNKQDTSGYSDPLIMQYTTNLLKEPFICCCLITSGLIITKSKPRAKTLTIWNIVIMVVFILSFASTKFISCNRSLYSELDGVISIPYCSARCHCSNAELFNPVCLGDKTFFSPCLAGCTTKSNTSGNAVEYTDCRCGNGVKATEGPCIRDNCNVLFAVSQVNGIITTGLLATIMVTNLIIILRCVPAKDKATAIGFQSALLGIIPYLPVRIIYINILDLFCKFRNEETGECRYYSTYLANFLASSTVVGVIISIILTAILVLLIKDLELYKKTNVKGEVNEDSAAEVDQFIQRSSQQYSNRTNDSLGELANNVGDDHDSVICETDL
ncbi:unnamed protein product [Brassicogethes aeneus]|uniref:Uncharacterized protein n=1 Tax=Brassicogethes aeneus TaxID=1431903 RepID=A0A9P0BFX9_BRAAE|nr:unnamed protein product [Brassicogethes aeneus]